jgi:hypothetical protein
MDSNSAKAVIDLFDYVKEIGKDRPEIKTICRDLNIDPKTMWDAVVTTAHSASVTYPDISTELCNQLFKLGVTIGYKYAVKRQMEEAFGKDGAN